MENQSSWQEKLARYEKENDELRLRNESLEDFVENASIPLHWVNEQGIIIWANQAELDAITDETLRLRRLCELNVLQQVDNVARCNIVQNAWARGQELSIHGWAYDIHDGILHKLRDSIDSITQIPEQYRLY